MSDIVVGEADSGRHLAVSVGDAIVVRLRESPTTGYRWTVNRIADGLALESDDFSTQPEAGIGAGGVRTFRFRAQRPGTAQVEVTLQRAWEAQPAQHYRLTVQVT